MSPQSLPLRDVHLPPSPSWWPLAPGWWLVIAVIVLVIGGAWVWWWRGRQRQSRWLAAFDAELQRATTPAQRLAAISMLLRRAGRSVDPHADRLQGDAWLQFLDGRKSKDHGFSQGPGRAVLEGGFQRAPVVSDLPAIEALARQRFVALMRGRR
ncbi:DUF4381 domain-containing protein [Xanthomonas vasicola]|uniref:DUF4381 domain-containing protein n=1 Tax=Xanthomonas vasicola TaxID=56459 RepID=UPI0001CC0526|nr:DUF4381 domain-containing protein [Xanthomonas vasicola]AZR32270.1 DUF4381 domain-containing protein [Xanthomonas vasicola pv. musacearum NCPPB 4379]KFA08911.1 hypothetical protein KWM_0112145 [Xanthomonas vasicola pv. musacearum NCPPB 2005]KFA10588.1 hypothetical protein KWQ_0110495 [Xanthomonas vasicola pv. musacearum NCPPB 4380]KFA19873.1 hypothetical protein A11G_0106735 [Xanthomonas vasicola pv. musacearum NCPPB 4392]KFA22850.1 hypothetical protein KWU_0109410 [Xanthomonas vasicola pv.